MIKWQASLFNGGKKEVNGMELPGWKVNFENKRL
ncbi:MAG: hypothetical protein K0Q95_351 [Bacteroidota bacterium]|jgi:hypothetical protein|nr:hypothetical protein [Bacteroidota bacterium]